MLGASGAGGWILGSWGLCSLGLCAVAGTRLGVHPVSKGELGGQGGGLIGVGAVVGDKSEAATAFGAVRNHEAGEETKEARRGTDDMGEEVTAIPDAHVVPVGRRVCVIVHFLVRLEHRSGNKNRVDEDTQTTAQQEGHVVACEVPHPVLLAHHGREHRLHPPVCVPDQASPSVHRPHPGNAQQEMCPRLEQQSERENNRTGEAPRAHHFTQCSQREPPDRAPDVQHRSKHRLLVRVPPLRLRDLGSVVDHHGTPTRADTEAEEEEPEVKCLHRHSRTLITIGFLRDTLLLGGRPVDAGGAGEFADHRVPLRPAWRSCLRYCLVTALLGGYSRDLDRDTQQHHQQHRGPQHRALHTLAQLTGNDGAGESSPQHDQCEDRYQPVRHHEAALCVAAQRKRLSLPHKGEGEKGSYGAEQGDEKEVTAAVVVSEEGKLYLCYESPGQAQQRLEQPNGVPAVHRHVLHPHCH
eukprot:Hpha_TRINITY_DN26561_c0_g1::TRINITY_DN26561_c0_g1_i1::g.112907::m.112907